jgi:hypothetical protein
MVVAGAGVGFIGIVVALGLRIAGVQREADMVGEAYFRLPPSASVWASRVL